MATPDKDTIYIDIDDEITGIIDKLRASDSKVVALVLPKRAAVLQSVVNMKLLKRATDQAKKNLVLVTTEASLMPLAGAVGLHVAKTITSKPEVPTPPQTDDDREETVSEAEEDGEIPDFSKKEAAAVAVGELAGAPPAPSDDMETLQLDDEDEAPEDAAEAAAVAGVAKVKKDKKLRVPDFDRFKWGLVIAALAIPLLFYGLFYALAVAPKAIITIGTDAVNVNANLGITVNPSAKTLDISQNIAPGKLVQESKTYTQPGTATGQKNAGTRASGVVTLTAKNCTSIAPAEDVPAGTGVSSNGLTFITQKTTSFSSSKIKNGCIIFSADSDTPVTAQTGGSNYNLSNGSSFSVSGRPDVTGVANGSFSGGTDNVIKVITQTDIDNAKAKITTQDATVKQTLITQLQQAGYFSIKTTFTASDPTITPSANVGDQAESFTVNEAINYTMLGAKQSDLAKLVDTAIAGQIDTKKQTILSEGLDNASFTVTGTDDKGTTITIQTVATAGPDLDVNEIKTQATGQKVGGFKRSLESRPGVTSVNVKLSPFWVSSIPKKTTKITVNISKPTTTVKKNGN